jgi:hypothetical protein
MVEGKPYIPHLLKDIVTTVSEKMQARTEDPFAVQFSYGLYQDVSKEVYKKKVDGENDPYPLIWLVMHFEERKGRIDVYAEVRLKLFIAMPTKADYSMTEREDQIFIPRLHPIYNELMKQLQKSKFFTTPSEPKHTKIDRPYWGGTETGNGETKNMFSDFIDAIEIKDLELSVKHQQANC